MSKQSSASVQYSMMHLTLRYLVSSPVFTAYTQVHNQTR